MLLESGLVREEGAHYVLTRPLASVPIPATLHDALMARLDRLPAAKAVAQLGAVLGREFAYALLQALAHLDEATLQARLEQLVAAELLYQRGRPPRATYRFKHALIQDAAYASLLKSTRQQVHQQVAQVLEAQFPETVATQPELVAQHYTEAGLTEQAIPYWQRAGQQALPALGQPGSGPAPDQRPGAARHAPRDPGAGPAGAGPAACPGAGVDGHQGQAAPEVEQTYARARALCAQVGDTPQLFPTLRGLWRFYRNRGALPTARELGEQLYRLAQRAADPTHLLEAHDALGTTLFYLGDYAAARTHLEQGIALTDPAAQRALALRHGEAPGVRCLAMAANTLWCLGYPAQAVRRSQEALALAQALAHPYSLALAQHFAAFLHHRRREAPAVQAQADALLTLATAQGFPLWVGYGHLLAGLGAGHAGPGRRRAWRSCTRAWRPSWPWGRRCRGRSVWSCSPRRRGTPARSKRGCACWPRPWRRSRPAGGVTCSRRRIGSRASCCCARPSRMRPRPKPASSRPSPLPAASRPNPGSCAPP